MINHYSKQTAFYQLKQKGNFSVIPHPKGDDE